jgi:hypothetical protein
VALLALCISSPVYARGGADVLAEIFFRVLLEGMAHSIPGPAPVPVPVPVGPVVPLVIPNPQGSNFDDGRGARLKDQALGYLPPYQAPTFRVRSFTRSFYTMVGGPAQDASQLVLQDGIEDPAVTVSEDLGAAISRHYGSHDVGLMQPPAPSTTTAPVAATQPGTTLGSGFALQVSTTHWELKSVSSNPIHILYGVSHYGVYYDAKFQLTDQRDGSLLAAGDCDVGPGATDPAPTYAEAMADGGQRLNAMLQAAAHECALQMEEDGLGIRYPADPEVKSGPPLRAADQGHSSILLSAPSDSRLDPV